MLAKTTRPREPALRRRMERVRRQMRVACRRLDIAVAEQLSDHRQGFFKRLCPVLVTMNDRTDCTMAHCNA